ncbi:MAG: aldo/keto reductase [Candidatus Micrarchaeota archaeon]|nr:aldo/keto reductase [Candidatus Micrarchaeota archaeon]
MAIRTKPLGKTGESLPELGIGTWKMGGSPKNEIAAIRESISLGMGLVDTAEMYGNERMVGKAIEGAEDLFLATKVSPHHFRHDDVIRSCKESISKLGVKSIDLYQLHWPSHSVPIGETISAMEELVDKGLVRYIGVSNFSALEMNEALESMKRYDIVSNQVEYSLMVREIEGDLMDYCSRNKITIIAYSPVARGAMLNGSQPLLSQALDAIGSRHGKTRAQVALNWVINGKNVVAIPKTSHAERVGENAGSSGWDLSAEERRLLEDAAIGKKSTASRIKPFMSGMGLLSGAYQGLSSFRNRNSHRSSSTTKSSKK